ncbi:ArsA family ATPase [Candidatus Aminicenantes bacterium AC-708-M15]|nr:ArsA family ATPase [Candidatus Aminicenantes bacterium AC-335-G13]MCP2603922.1 ArsA family ATPase [Candidatus Aminicenantes bacterium AC-708-M15]MCP2618119.1 ArsA family ATPase [Candidatus Aminicenantes bacterium AC-335-A11]
MGKTTISAATGILASQFGHRTMIISADAAHSLSDAFEVELSDTPRKIAENLYAQEIDAQKEIERNWGIIQDYLTKFFNSQGIDNIEADEMSVFPGLEELFSLMQIRKYHDSGEFDLIIVDCAPTGDTLRLLSAPEITNWYLKHIFPIQRTAAKAIRPVANRVLPFPFPSDDVFESIKKITTQIQGLSDILRDSGNSTIRLILNPEKMVIKESQRAFTYFNLFNYSVDLIIVNKKIPDKVKDPFFREWKTIQTEHRKTIFERFHPIPIREIDLFDKEITGIKKLERIGRIIYGEEDPADIFYSEKPFKIEKNGTDYIFSMNLPFLKKEEIELYQKGEELIIKAGKYKRNILLPRILMNLNIKEAKFKNHILSILFTKGGE